VNRLLHIDDDGWLAELESVPADHRAPEPELPRPEELTWIDAD